MSPSLLKINIYFLPSKFCRSRSNLTVNWTRRVGFRPSVMLMINPPQFPWFLCFIITIHNHVEQLKIQKSNETFQFFTISNLVDINCNSLIFYKKGKDKKRDELLFGSARSLILKNSIVSSVCS